MNMAGLHAFQMHVCLLVYYYLIIISAQDITFKEPTKCSSDCSFIKSNGSYRQCKAYEVAFSLPTTQRCSELLPSKFFASVADIPPRLKKQDVNGTFSQPTLDATLKMKIDVRISEPNHNSMNGIFLEIDEPDVRHCYLLDFNGTLGLYDIIPSYSTGGDRIFSFYPCLDVKMTSDYNVVAFPLPLVNEKTDSPRVNYAHLFSWNKWQRNRCESEAKMYIESSSLTVGFGKLEMKLNASSLFTYYCPLGFKLLSWHELDKEWITFQEVSFTNGTATAGGVQKGIYKLKFVLKGSLGNTIYSIPGDHIGVSMKGNCLSFPCGISSLCNQHGNSPDYCSCPQHQILKGINCYSADPCSNSPCGSRDHGTCNRHETNSSVYHTCTCYRGFYAAHNTCLGDPCYSNPCTNAHCFVNVSSNGIFPSCICNTRFHITQDGLCKDDPCFKNPCGNGDCLRREVDTGFTHSCLCHPGSYNSRFSGACEPDPCFNSPCGNGTCINMTETNSGTTYNCKCNNGFYATQGTCKVDPCIESPCGNGTCIISEIGAGLTYNCKCNAGFYETHGTCKEDFCYGSDCHPGNCTRESNSYTCRCPQTHFFSEGKCLQNDSKNLKVLYVVTGVLLGIGFILLICLLKRKKRDINGNGQSHSNKGDDQPSQYDQRMLRTLEEHASLSTIGNSERSSSIEHTTYRMNSTEASKPLLTPKGIANPTRYNQNFHVTEPSTSRGFYTRVHADVHEIPGARPYSCSSSDSASQLVCHQHSRQTSLESDPDAIVQLQYVPEKESSL